MKIKSNFGFTLPEVIITVAIAAILTGVAVPSFQRFLQNSRLDQSAQSLYSVFNSARQEALTAGLRSFVCRSQTNPINVNNPQCLFPNPGDWNFGLISYRALSGMIIPEPNGTFGNQRFNSGNFAPTTVEQRIQMVIRSIDFQDNGVEYNSNSGDRTVVFSSDGTLVNDAPFRIAVCDSRGEAEGMYIEINAIGRVFLKSTTANGTDTDCTPS